jgi:two-component system sensor histidine kinase/response regulator
MSAGVELFVVQAVSKGRSKPNSIEAKLMEEHHFKVLLVEDNLVDFRSIQERLTDATLARDATTFDLIHADRLATGLSLLINSKIDVILLNLSLPDSQGIDTIVKMRAMAPNVPIITLTSVEDEIFAVEAMQQGAQDYLVKREVTSNTLSRAIRYAIERQRMVAELAQKALELESKNIELDEFAHTVAHQVQGLLSQMVGYTGYIEMNYKGTLPEEVLGLLKRILQGGNKMNNVISELLLLASVRKDEVKYWPLNMGRIVNESIKRLAFQIETYEAEISQPESWPVALGYPSWIEEVWVNYISNGLKYGGPSPQITLGADGPSKGMIRFWVRDQGQGISAADQSRLFVPHTRLRQTRVRGEGLGLSIVRRIVHKCGGRVGVDSQLNVGSTFWFTLPEVAETIDSADQPQWS